MVDQQVGDVHALTRTEKQKILQRVYEHGTRRGDSLDDAEHTAASGIDCNRYSRAITASFVLDGSALRVTVGLA